MTSRRSTSIFLPSPKATSTFAQSLAPQLRHGDAILLAGDLGSGKTHFARALIQARLAAGNKSEDVPSPTYTLVQTYFDGVCDIWHADPYRLSGPDEVAELGILAAQRDNISLIEWPDRLGSLLPENTLDIELFHCGAPNARRADIRWHAARWDAAFAAAGGSGCLIPLTPPAYSVAPRAPIFPGRWLTGFGSA